MDCFLYFLITGLWIYLIDRLLFQKHRYVKLNENQNKNQHENLKKEPVEIKKKISHDVIKKCFLYDEMKNFEGNNIISRHNQATCHDLDNFDHSIKLTQKRVTLDKGKLFKCYGCGHFFRRNHPVYIFSCFKCGALFQENRHLTGDMTGKIALVTGCRAKLGHQVTLKLLRAGARVYGTTRYVDGAQKLFEKYDDFGTWSENLIIYPDGAKLDYTSANIEKEMILLKEFIEKREGHLDILINIAGRTIINRDNLCVKDRKDRYGDGLYLTTSVNSWQVSFGELEQSEMEMLYRINAVGTTLMVQTMIPLLKKCDGNPYIVNIHARAGLMQTRKDHRHPHLNMVKSAVAMLTKSLSNTKLTTLSGNRFMIHGVDPGWFSMDEYTEDERPMMVPPLDEVDGAARVLYPVFKKMNTSPLTQRHFNKYKI